MRKRFAALLAALCAPLMAAATVALAPSASAAPYCGITWGSTAKHHASTASHPLIGVRAGQHTCYDRLVLDFSGPVNGYSVRYVTQVRDSGRGAVVPVSGGARLQITVQAPAYDSNGHATYTPANPARLVNVTGWRTFRQLAWAGTFEGYTDLGLGVRARLPFRVLLVPGPGSHARIVVDVAHRW